VDQDFWQARWARNEIGFHLKQINPFLQRHWPALAVPAATQVLVPLCGKSLDLAWLAGQGLQVLGVELAEKAVQEFFDEQNLQPDIRQHGAFTRYQAGSLQLWCGDFFALSAEDVAGCTAFFDRAALIALPPEMRQRYVQHLSQILPASCRGLLVTVEYDQNQHAGPPFSVDEGEVAELYAAPWNRQMLAREDVLQQNWKFLQRGISRLDEVAYRLQR
jgi:thiopurine S-methyltransferase